MSDIEAGELHSKLSRPNYNLLLDSLNLLFKTTLKHSRLQTSVTSLVNCNKLMKLGFDQSVAFLQNESRSFWTHYSSDTLYGREGVFIGYRIEISSNFVDTMKNDDANDDIIGLYWVDIWGWLSMGALFETNLYKNLTKKDFYKSQL